LTENNSLKKEIKVLKEKDRRELLSSNLQQEVNNWKTKLEEKVISDAPIHLDCLNYLNGRFSLHMFFGLQEQSFREIELLVKNFQHIQGIGLAVSENTLSLVSSLPISVCLCVSCVVGYTCSIHEYPKRGAELNRKDPDRRNFSQRQHGHLLRYQVTR
jgi:hypothetical protein